MSTATWVKTDTRDRPMSISALGILKVLGSLKITVFLFALAIILIFVGTLAQDEMDLVDVKHQFFNCWISIFPLDVLAPITIFPNGHSYFGDWKMVFPGGATIGLALLINLIAAKVTRFSVSAKGNKLGFGIAIALAGSALIAAVIVSGHTTDGLQGKPPISYEALWGVLRVGLGVIAASLIVYSIVAKLPALAKTISWAGAVTAAALCLVIFFGGDTTRLDAPGLRIVWQLLQSTIASTVLLVGLLMVFGKRGGNVLIHIGIGLMMFGQFIFGDRQVEQRIGLAEGAATSIAVNENELELAFIDNSSRSEEVVVAVPQAMLEESARSEAIIQDPQLPAAVRVVKFFRNAGLAEASDSIDNPATMGIGKRIVAVQEKQVGGAMTDDRNMAAAYVEFLNSNREPIGTYLLTQQRNDLEQLTAGMQPNQYESLVIGDREYEVGLRFRRILKPYEVTLKDVERINYSGTETPRDYSSRIEIRDRASGDVIEGKTWMNNPIRYRGETFYQSRYFKIPTSDGKSIETTGLQVVENPGWVVPYISCMMVFVGMFAHFGGTFLRFASRYDRGAIPKDVSQAQSVPGVGKTRAKRITRTTVIASTTALGVVLLTALAFMTDRDRRRSEIDWRAISSLPVQHEGRTKPLDTVAKNVLQVVAKPIFGATPRVKDTNGDSRSATEWLFGLMTDQAWVDEAQVIRIYSKEVIDFFGLEQRSSFRYSYEELEPKLTEFREIIDRLRTKDPKKLDYFEQKLSELHRQLNAIDLIRYSYRLPALPQISEDATPEERQTFFSRVTDVMEQVQFLDSNGPPSIIPPVGEATEENLVDAKWMSYGPAVTIAYVEQRFGLSDRPPNPAILAYTDIIDAMRAKDGLAVNKAVEAYTRLINDMPLAAVKMNQVATEQWLNKLNPTAQGVALYIVAILTGFVGFLFQPKFFRSFTFWLIVGVFVIHTIAIVSRIYISGRAPVINLYSSAVFIGWAAVLFCLVLEVLYPLGVSNLLAAVAGASTLSVARFLDTSDTMHVLQAVLDTQFWLSTHVITVTIGYSTTFLAGFFGVAALVHRMVTRYDKIPVQQRSQESRDIQSILYRITYGVLCFALFFSFIGTVLGGLWADDSWGRFWGWDPKENGALMIVLWNALMIHSRWDRQVGERGFAQLAVFGNVITAWSWFGTNQLGIGLHSYGFTSGALLALIWFVVANVAFMFVAFFLTRERNTPTPSVG